MANAGSVGIIEVIDGFYTPTVGDAGAGVAWATSEDAGNTAWVRAVNATVGLHATSATDATDDDMIELCADNLDTSGQQGYAMFEALLQFDVADTIAINFGFNDDSLDASNSLPAELATATWTTNAATFVGLVYDVDATNDDWHCMWVDADVDATNALADLRMAGSTLVAAKWIQLRVELFDRGSGNGVKAVFHVAQEGKTFTKEFNTTVNRATALCPYFGYENRAAAAHVCILKYVKRAWSIAD